MSCCVVKWRPLLAQHACHAGAEKRQNWNGDTGLRLTALTKLGIRDAGLDNSKSEKPLDPSQLEALVASCAVWTFLLYIPYATLAFV